MLESSLNLSFFPPCSYGTAYTMPVTPRGGSGMGGAYLPVGMGPNKSRSLRGGVVIRNGGGAGGPGGKGMSLPGVMRTSSTLPRMSARQLQQPIPHNAPSFLRPNSSINFPPGGAGAPVGPTSSPLVTQAQSFQPTSSPQQSQPSTILPPPPSSSSSSKTPDVNELDMDALCKSMTDHVVQDGESCD